MFKLFTQLPQNIFLNGILGTHFEMYDLLHDFLAFPLMEVGNFQNHNIVVVHRNFLQTSGFCVFVCVYV